MAVRYGRQIVWAANSGQTGDRIEAYLLEICLNVNMDLERITPIKRSAK